MSRERGSTVSTKDQEKVAGVKFYSNLHVLANSPIKQVAKNAQITRSFLRQEGCTAESGGLPAKSMVSQFVFFPVSGIPTGKKEDGVYKVFPSSFRPSLAVNVGNLISMGDVAIQADLVRTTDVIRQVHTDGMLLESQRNMLNRALWREIQWLKHEQVPELADDPRVTPREQLLKTLLGEDRYLMDTSFTAFKKAAGALFARVGDGNTRTISNQVREEISAIQEANQEAVDKEKYSEGDLRTILGNIENVVEGTLNSLKVRAILQRAIQNPSYFLFEREVPVNRYTYGRERYKDVIGILRKRAEISPSSREHLAAYAIAACMLTKAFAADAGF